MGRPKRIKFSSSYRASGEVYRRITAAMQDVTSERADNVHL